MIRYQRGWQQHLKRRALFKHNATATASVLADSDSFRSRMEEKEEREN